VRHKKKTVVTGVVAGLTALLVAGTVGSAQATTPGPDRAEAAAQAAHRAVAEAQARLRAGSILVAQERAAGKRVIARPATLQTTRDIQVRMAAYGRNHHGYAWAVYTNLLTDQTIVETDAPGASVAAIVRAPHGRSARGTAVVVEHGRPHLDDRRTAQAPFSGGAQLYGWRNAAFCTGGFAVNWGATPAYVTAAHCYNKGDTVSNSAWTHSVGTVATRGSYGTWGGTDAELITGSTYRGAVYYGGVVATSTHPIAGAGDFVPGYAHYCFSGATSGEQCDETVISVDQLISADGFTVSGRQAVLVPDKAHPGDSGAPFYAYDQFKQVYIRGIETNSGGTGKVSSQSWGSIRDTFGVSMRLTELVNITAPPD
jgi:hypothetical protein